MIAIYLSYGPIYCPYNKHNIAFIIDIDEISFIR